jgi:hypothetical protein
MMLSKPKESPLKAPLIEVGMLRHLIQLAPLTGIRAVRQQLLRRGTCLSLKNHLPG